MARGTQSWYELRTGLSQVVCEVNVGGIWNLLSRYLRIHIIKRVEVDGGIDGDMRVLRCRQQTLRAQRDRKG